MSRLNVWSIFIISVFLVVLATFTLLRSIVVHKAVVNKKMRMRKVGHASMIFLLYSLPLLVGMTQVLSWAAYYKGWENAVVMLLVGIPYIPVIVFYCFINGASNASEYGTGDAITETLFKKKDVLKYLTYGGIKKPHQTDHHCDLIVGPPVGGLEVLEVFSSGSVRLLYPRQLFQENIAGGRSVIAGPFESVAHVSVLTKDDHVYTAINTPSKLKKSKHEDPSTPKGITSQTISVRYSNNDYCKSVEVTPRSLTISIPNQEEDDYQTATDDLSFNKNIDPSD